MDILDRLLQHDHWTTRHLLEQCRVLADAEWDARFDVGHGSIRSTILHMIINVEVWTDLMLNQTMRSEVRYDGPLVEQLIARWEDAYNEFSDLAYQLAEEERLDSLWLDTLDNPPRAKSYGGTISHVVTHNMQHRAEMIHMMTRLGVQDVIEGDLLSWERSAREAIQPPQLSLLKTF